MSAALIPPCAALECERTGWTLLTMPPSSVATRSPMSWWFRSPPQCPIISIRSGRSTATWAVIVFALAGPTPMFTMLMPVQSSRTRW